MLIITVDYSAYPVEWHGGTMAQSFGSRIFRHILFCCCFVSFPRHHRHIYLHLRVRIKSYLGHKLGPRAGWRGTSESVGSVLTDNARHIRSRNKTALEKIPASSVTTSKQPDSCQIPHAQCIGSRREKVKPPQFLGSRKRGARTVGGMQI